MFPNRRIELLFRRFGTIFSLLWTRETWISRIETAEKSVWYVELVFGKRVMSVRGCVIVFGKRWNYVFERWNGIGKWGNCVMEISKWCSEAGCLCRNLSLSHSEKGEIMFLSDEMVLWNGVMVCESEGIRLGIGGMVWWNDVIVCWIGVMKEADFVSASCRPESGLNNFKK